MIHGTQAIHPRIGTGNLTARFRRLGLLPLLFFILHANYYREVGGLPHMLWMCNIGNLVLSLGLFLARPVLIRVAVIWLLPLDQGSSRCARQSFSF